VCGVWPGACANKVCAAAGVAAHRKRSFRNTETSLHLLEGFGKLYSCTHYQHVYKHFTGQWCVVCVCVCACAFVCVRVISIASRTIESLYEELVSEGIIVRPPKVTLSDYVGEYSFLGTTLRQANIEPMPSLTDVRRLVTEYTILPLGGATQQPAFIIHVFIETHTKSVRVGTGGLGDFRPPAGSRAEPRWGPGAMPAEAGYIQTVCSCQMLFYAGLLPSPSSTPLPSPPKKKTSDLREYPMTQHGRGRVGTCPLVLTRGYATVQNTTFNVDVDQGML